MAAPSVPPSPLGLVRAAQAVAAEGRLRLFSALSADRREALVRAGGVAAARVGDADRREALVRAGGVAARLARQGRAGLVGARRVGGTVAHGHRGGLAALIARVDDEHERDRD